LTSPFDDYQRELVMKRFIAVAGAAILFMGSASAVTAEPRDSVERGTRLDTDALRDDVRTNRLQIPRHPLGAEPLAQATPGSKGKAKLKKSGGSSQ
jgi:hypothetical protein